MGYRWYITFRNNSSTRAVGSVPYPFNEIVYDHDETIASSWMSRYPRSTRLSSDTKWRCIAPLCHEGGHFISHVIANPGCPFGYWFLPSIEWWNDRVFWYPVGTLVQSTQGSWMCYYRATAIGDTTTWIPIWSIFESRILELDTTEAEE